MQSNDFLFFSGKSAAQGSGMQAARGACDSILPLLYLHGLSVGTIPAQLMQ